jgi:histone H3/H4
MPPRKQSSTKAAEKKRNSANGSQISGATAAAGTQKRPTYNITPVSKGAAKSLCTATGYTGVSKDTYQALNDIALRYIDTVVSSAVASNGADRRTLTADDIARAANKLSKTIITPTNTGN